MNVARPAIHGTGEFSHGPKCLHGQSRGTRRPSTGAIARYELLVEARSRALKEALFTTSWLPMHGQMIVIAGYVIHVWSTRKYHREWGAT